MATYIIAEVGVNHNGDLDLARKLIEAAAQSGADAVKFQTFDSSSLVVKDSPKADYQSRSDGDGTQDEMLHRLQLSLDDHNYLKSVCHRNSVDFLSTPFGLQELEFLVNLGIPAIKIASGDITFAPLLTEASKYALSLDIPVYLSTGMSTMSDISLALDTLLSSGLPRTQIYLLHCVSSYPTSFEDANLRSLLTLSSAFHCPIGYSDHTLGIYAPIAAVALGAKVIEKHLTLDCNMIGPDHSASLEPGDFSKLVSAIRSTELSLGSGIKKPCDAELSTRLVARRSIRARHFIPKGSVLTEDDFVFLRPGDGLNPMFLPELLGKTANFDYEKHQLINL